MNFRCLLTVVLMALSLLSVQAGSTVIVNLKPVPDNSCSGQVSFEHVLGGLRIEAFMLKLPDAACKLVLLSNVEHSTKEDGGAPEMPHAEPREVGTFFVDAQGLGYFDSVDSALMLSRLKGRELAVICDGETLARGRIPAP